MTFALHKMWMFNFRVYSDHHEFEFPETPGLYFFSGTNKVDDIGSNGAGKSTLLEAITWCLYGCTTRGLKANDIITWGLSTASVCVELTVGSTRFKVKRSQKPNVLLLIEDGIEKPVDQEELEKHLRLNFQGFTSAIMNAQFGVSFFQLRPTEKLDLFSKIMELDFWLLKSEEAAEVSKKLLREISYLDTALAREQGSIEGAKADLKTLREKAADFDEETAQRGAALHLELRAKVKELDKLHAKMVKLRKKHSELTSGMRELADREKDAEEVRDSILLNIQKQSKARAELVGALKVRHEEVEKHKQMPDTCPTCNQSIDPGRRHMHIGQLEGWIVETERVLESMTASVTEATGRLVKAKTSYQRASLEAAEWRNAFSRNSTNMTLTAGQIASLERECDKLQDEANTAIDRVNPYVQLIDKKREQLKASRENCVKLDDNKSKLEADNEAVSYWIKGFKRIRLFIIEQAFQTLEIEVNNSLAQLGMPDWSISFAIERENKSGGVTKGFIVLINSPNNPNPVKWESWSGGETQRLQLAGDLGLANLIMQQAGLTSTIEFYDEPSTHLSKEGMLDLANMLHDRAVTDKKQIWIIDHAAITNFGEFQGRIHAEKSRVGATITLE